MIHSGNFFDMTPKLNPLAVCKYLEQTGWKSCPFKRQGVKVYQISFNDDFKQVIVPLDKSFVDYKRSMYNAACEIAEVEKKSVEQVIQYLMHPDTDILKIRLNIKEVEAGDILFEDAMRLYENAKKLVTAAALDVLYPQKIHYGRTDVKTQQFLNRCRFGQTEVGSYVVPIIFPFAELTEKNECRQLSIFSDEDNCANSLTRRVTKKIMDNVGFIKTHVDSGDLDALSNNDAGISSNFFEALNGLNLQSENAEIEMSAEWSPVVKSNRSNVSNIKFTNDYYQPLSTVINKIKDTTPQQTNFTGKIKSLNAVANLAQREGGVATLVFITNEYTVKHIELKLLKEDYEKAVNAHLHGSTVKVIGNLQKGNKLKLSNVTFSILD